MSIVSKRVRYALHGLAYVARFGDGEAIPFEAILRYLRSYSQRLTLSPGYIAKIFQDLSRAGFMVATSGPRGGYRLARPAEAMPLIDIVQALDGPLLSDCCLLSAGPCPQEATCGVRRTIHEAELVFYNFFEKETVASVAHRMTFPATGSSASETTAHSA